MSGNHQELTYLEKRMRELISEGSENAITSAELQDQFALEGSDLDDIAVRKIIRGLIVDHHIPIASRSRGRSVGFFVAVTEEEAEAYISNLLSRIAGIQERLDHFRKAVREQSIRAEKEQMDLFHLAISDHDARGQKHGNRSF